MSSIITFSLSVAETVFVQPWLWFSQLLYSVGLTPIYLAALSMYLAFKFLVAPLIGSKGDASSDTVKKRNSKDDP